MRRKKEWGGGRQHLPLSSRNGCKQPLLVRRSCSCHSCSHAQRCSGWPQTLVLRVCGCRCCMRAQPSVTVEMSVITQPQPHACCCTTPCRTCIATCLLTFHKLLPHKRCNAPYTAPATPTHNTHNTATTQPNTPIPTHTTHLW